MSTSFARVMIGRSLLAAAVAAGAAGTSASAQGWRTVGSTTFYDMQVDVTGGARCATAGVILNGSCTAQGNVLTLTQGATSLVLTFIGVPQLLSLEVGNSRTPFTYGFIRQELIGDPMNFTFPYTSVSSDNYHRYSSFSFDIRLSALGASTCGPFNFSRAAYNGQKPGLRSVNFQARGPVACRIPRPPSGASLNMVVINPRAADPIVLRPEDAIIELVAVSSLIPEPATIALTATGLLGLVAVARRHRSR